MHSATMCTLYTVVVPVAHAGDQWKKLDGALVCISSCAGLLSPLFCPFCPAFSFVDVDIYVIDNSMTYSISPMEHIRTCTATDCEEEEDRTIWISVESELNRGKYHLVGESGLERSQGRQWVDDIKTWTELSQN